MNSEAGFFLGLLLEKHTTYCTALPSTLYVYRQHECLELIITQLPLLA